MEKSNNESKSNKEISLSFIDKLITLINSNAYCDINESSNLFNKNLALVRLREAKDALIKIK